MVCAPAYSPLQNIRARHGCAHESLRSTGRHILVDECHGRCSSCARCSIGDVECQHSLVKLLYLRIQVLSLCLCILCKRLCLVYLCQQGRSLVLCCVIGSLGLSYRLDKSIVVNSE